MIESFQWLTTYVLSRMPVRDEERGATAAEYGLLVALIAAVIIAGATLLGNNVNNKLSSVGNTVGAAGGGS